MDQIKTTLEQFVDGVNPEETANQEQVFKESNETKPDEQVPGASQENKKNNETKPDEQVPNKKNSESSPGDQLSQKEKNSETKPDEQVPGASQENKKNNESSYWEDLGYESEDGLKQELSNLKTLRDELSQKEESLKNKDDLLNKYSKNLNPLEYFPDENSYKAAQVAKQNPSLNQSALYRVAGSDVNSMTDEDAIVLNELLEISDGSIGESSLRKRIRSNYKLDIDKNDADDFQRQNIEFGQIDLKRDANKAKARLSQLMNGVEIPQQKNIEEIERENKAKNETFIKDLQNKWVQPLNSIEKNLDKIEIPVNGDSVEFTIDDKMKNEVKDLMWKNISTQGVEPNEDLTNVLVQAGKDEIKMKYFDSILKKVVEHVETKLKDQHYKDTNGTPPNSAEAPENTSGNGDMELEEFVASGKW